MSKKGNNENKKGKNIYNKENLDILELFSRNLDLEEKKVNYGTPGGSIGTDNYDIEPGMTPCLTCKYMFGGCPQEIDSEKMELISNCAHYEPSEISESELIEEPKKEPIKDMKKKEEIFFQIDDVSGGEFITEENSSNSEFNNAKKSKKFLVDDILAKWHEEQGKLRIYCAKCEQEMIKKMTPKKEFYMCPNFPECRIQAEPLYISKAVLQNVATNKIKGDLIVLYRWDENKNIVNVSEIFSEKKLFL